MDRATYLGGPDAAAVCGISPYKTAHQVWLEKTGRAPDRTVSMRMRVGLAIEPTIAALYEEETGKKLATIQPVRHPKLAFIGGSPDRITEAEPLTVELKNADLRTIHRWGEPGTDQVPEEYLVQVQHYMSVMDHARADLAVLLGGNDFRIYHLLRDRELEGTILERLERFWVDHVQADKPPPADGSEGAAEMLARLFPQHRKEKVPCTPELAELVGEWAAARAAREAWEGRESKFRQRIEERVGDSGGVITPAGTVTITTCKGRAVTDWKALAAAAGVPEHLIQQHTRIGKSYPIFKFTPAKES